MFIQIIQGKCRDETALRALMDSWRAEMAPHADGWLGGTYGVTDDGMFVAVVRFESHELAKRNSDRPEQGAWWAEVEKCFDGPVTFHDCDDVTMMLNGGSDDAGFVQVIQGRVTEPERLRRMMTSQPDRLHQLRPDIIGATLAIDADGTFTETVAFSSEAAAREGEKREMPADMQAEFQDEMAAMQDVHYLDLHHPWFASRENPMAGKAM